MIVHHSPLIWFCFSISLSRAVDCSSLYIRLLMLVILPFIGKQKDNCAEVINELGGQCWPKHQLTQLLIVALIRAANDRNPCNLQYKSPAKKCRHTQAHVYISTGWNTKKGFMRKDVFFLRLSLYLSSFHPHLSPVPFFCWPQTFVGQKHIRPQK